MTRMKWSAKGTVAAIFLLGLLLLLPACGPAGGSAERAGSESASSNQGRSLLGDMVRGEQDVSSPTPSQPDDEADGEAVAQTGADEAKDAQEKGATIAVLEHLVEYDATGLQVGFTEDGHPYRGDPGAPVVIQEYSDYQCPYCARFFSETLPSLLENQIANGDAVLIYYDFPLSNIHPQASAAANAARCAGEQGATAYWEMHDFLFGNTEGWSDQDAGTMFVGYAKEINLDVESFEDCVTGNRYAADIQADLASGANLGVSGTPSFFINGQLFVGARPLDSFVSAIEIVQNGGQLASDEPQQQQAPAAAPTPVAFAEGFAGAMGDPNAPVTIVEFTDYQCPYCSQHSLQTMPQIVTELVETGRVYYVLKDLPLDQLHPDARAAAEAARCAGEQGGYWAMHDELFANQSGWAGQGQVARELFVGYAVEIGLDESEMIACLESGQFAEAVEANVAEASALGVTGTPMFFVDGYPLNGARPIEHFLLAVQYAEDGTLADAYAPVEQQAQQPSGPPSPANVEIGDAHVLGDPEAPITIVEFTDFQCPFCERHFLQTYPRIVEDYVETGVVRYVFKDFPLNSIHPQAAEAAEAARCAKEQNAFLDMHDVLFRRQEQWSGQSPTGLFVNFAGELGLDTEAFEQCLTSGKFSDAVSADLNQGIQLGVTGTPAFFINGYGVSGAQPFELFEQAIESLLADQER